MNPIQVFVVGCVFTIGGAIPLGILAGIPGVVCVALVIVGMLMVCVGAETWKPKEMDDGQSDLR